MADLNIVLLLTHCQLRAHWIRKGHDRFGSFRGKKRGRLYTMLIPKLNITRQQTWYLTLSTEPNLLIPFLQGVPDTLGEAS